MDCAIRRAIVLLRDTAQSSPLIPRTRRERDVHGQPNHLPRPTEVGSDHVEPHVHAQRLEEAEQFRFDTLCFLEENVDAQGEKGFGEIDRLQCIDSPEDLWSEVQ